MTEHFILAAQLSTGHSPSHKLTENRVLPILDYALDVVPLDILILGWEEIPELYQTLTAKETRRTDQVFLWYPLLSDYPGLTSNCLVVNYKGVVSQGWGEFVAGGEINETFRFACPNNPDALETTLSYLERVLTTYYFDGVFLDKFRFPSPANGLQEMLGCFCKHCDQAAGKWGLDLDQVRSVLEHPQRTVGSASPKTDFPGAQWLEELLAGHSVLQEFVRFRCDSVTRVTASVRVLTDRLGKKLALDVFSPGLAPLVGQDYATLRQYAEWVKPMIYRFAKGPAGLCLELPQLANDLARFIGCGLDDILKWTHQHVPSLVGTDFERINSEGVPLDLIADETQKAVELMSPASVYLGLETVSMPGIIDITPENVREIVCLGQAVGIAGVALSWDILHTPVENLQPLTRL